MGHMKVAALVFDGFETLDVFGPVEILGRIKDHFQVTFYSLPGNMIHNEHGVTISTEKLANIQEGVDVLIIPGGPGTRKEIDNLPLLDILRKISEKTKYVLTVCTGSALLARTGLLDGLKATSNKRAFDWVCSTREQVKWIRQARWIVDGKYYTSSGVSAGMDMTLGFLSDLDGIEFARKIAYQIEYQWQEDKELDNFYKQ
jgi:putative intracellular protease/amidase